MIGVKLSSLMMIKPSAFHFQQGALKVMELLSTIHTQNPIQSHLLLEKQSSCGMEDAITVKVLRTKPSMETGLLTHVLLRPNLLLGALDFSSTLILKHA